MGNELGQFMAPFHVAILPDARIAVTDNNNHRIQIF